MTNPEFDGPAVHRLFEGLAAELMRTGRVEVRGFGVFELVVQKARRARNPRTGVRIDVPARTVVRFRPSESLKARAAEQPPET